MYVFLRSRHTRNTVNLDVTPAKKSQNTNWKSDLCRNAHVRSERKTVGSFMVSLINATAPSLADTSCFCRAKV